MLLYMQNYERHKPVDRFQWNSYLDNICSVNDGDDRFDFHFQGACKCRMSITRISASKLPEKLTKQHFIRIDCLLPFAH